MGEKTKNTLMALLIVGIVSMTIAYAALTQRLNINSNARVLSKNSSWNIHFTNLSAPTKTGYAQVRSGEELVLDSSSTTLSGLTATLSAPGDSVSYTFDVINEGTINAKINTSGVHLANVASATCTGSPVPSAADCTLVKNNLTYTLTYANGAALADGDKLAAGATKSLKLTITYNASATDVPSDDVTISGLDSYIDYIQDEANGS